MVGEGHGAANDHPGYLEKGSHVLVMSLCINLTVLVLGFLFWPIFDTVGWTCARDGGTGFKKSMRQRLCSCSKKSRFYNTVSLNYIHFLRESRNMFWWLTILAAAVTVPCWGPGPISMGIMADHLNTLSSLDDARGFSIMLIDTLLRGILAFCFVEKLRRGCEEPSGENRDKEVVSRTLWLCGLPVVDSATGESFRFCDEDFARVEDDLREALTKDLNKNRIGQSRTVEMLIHVAPVVDKWHQVSMDKRYAEEQKEAYKRLGNMPRANNFWNKWLTSQYKKKQNQCKVQLTKLAEKLRGMEKGLKGLAGTAFVTFQQKEDRDAFLQKKQPWYSCQNYAYFTFGRAPFASVTLTCTRAPHPNDVAWLNLHITPAQQWLRGIVLVLLLFIAMFTIITPVAISLQLSELVTTFRHRAEQIAEAMHAEFLISHRDTSTSWKEVCAQLPGVMLVVINSLILPDLIWRIGDAIRLHRKSSSEVIQLHLNYSFLVLNSLVLPMLQLSSIHALVHWANKQLDGPTIWEFVEHVTGKIIKSSGVFAVKYILNCACVSNINNLLQVAQLLGRWYAKKTARTAREVVDADTTWDFAWGYWYAWTISIFTMGIFLSSLIPSVLPASALFFTVQHFVDRHNLSRGVFSHGAEAENVMITRCLHYLRCIIAVWWILMAGLFLFLIRRDGGSLLKNWDAYAFLSATWAYRLVVAMAVMGFILISWSWWDHQSILHDSNFEEISIRHRGLHRRGRCDFLNPIFDRANKLMSWMERPQQYEPVGEAADGDATDIDDRTRRGSMILDSWRAKDPLMHSSKVNKKALNRSDSRTFASGPTGVVWNAKVEIVCPDSHPL
mmetsp:Transcript_21750/g.47376  ORF Transcript_21750/g.47376 Transcript_21750/m.47376 type:complete len:839 (-) Transcript_21750:741-3257(-)